MSTEIEKGRKWGQEVSNKLSETAFGVICLTRENLAAPWILFEAGALSKTPDAFVCTFLYDLAPTDVQQPLAEFQHTVNEKEDLRKLLHTINAVIARSGEKPLPAAVLDKAFETYWPELELELSRIPPETAKSKGQVRSERELLEEVLQTVRTLGRKWDAPGTPLSDHVPEPSDVPGLMRRAWRAQLEEGDGVPPGMRLILRPARLTFQPPSDLLIHVPPGSPVLERMTPGTLAHEVLEKAFRERIGFPVSLRFEPDPNWSS